MYDSKTQAETVRDSSIDSSIERENILSTSKQYQIQQKSTSEKMLDRSGFMALIPNIQGQDCV